ncbi:protein NRT1/ PTR FAMILY 5.6-like [Silene latifolia]|uniref:protein NRT1/ PTR FAMILY 5.6-like n=1 Tax=Silene latifolia TaxID=37657 RepID=UPI003D77D45C
MNVTKGKDSDEDNTKMYVHDSSIDFKGRVPLRASTGCWKAAFFILAIEFSEKLSYFGIGTNLITYMTKVMQQDLETAVKSVNIWSGVTAVMPLVGAFVADSYTGAYAMILFSASLYVCGLSLLTMAEYIPTLKPCTTCEHGNKKHEVLFFLAIYLVSLATGGYKPCLQSFGADQFDENNAKERKQKMSFFNWWNISLCCGIFFGVTLIVYMQDNVAWGLGFLILALTMAVSLLVFIFGRPFYRYKNSPLGSPLTTLLQVFVAAFVKRNLPSPFDPSFLYEGSKSPGKPSLSHTNRLRCLDKAAIIEEDQENDGPASRWRLASVTQVEELKLVIHMIPIWLSCLVFGVGIAQGTTFYVKQGSLMNRRLSKHFEIPPATLFIMTAIGMVITVALYDKVLLPLVRKSTKNERGINILTRMGIGMFILIIAIIISALVEKKRLTSARNGVSLSAFWLAPQFLLLGIGDGFSLVGMQEYFYDQVPDSMRSMGLGLYLSVIGVGSFLSTFLIIIVNKFSTKKWIGKDLNHSRLDYFYWFLTVIFVVNLCVYVYLARNYRYKNVERRVSDVNSCDDM